VSFLESPHLLKLPPITNHQHWEPFFKACEETDTVISLHCGASGFVIQGSPGGGLNVQTSLFPPAAFCAAVDWVWAGIPARYPDLKIALSEGGIGWVPMAINRLDYVLEHSGAGGTPWTLRRDAERGAAPELLLLHARRPRAPSTSAT
jgi:predicted TIM-barrel fold metal-dependent hydrolase